jgi:hypothetical protein
MSSGRLKSLGDSESVGSPKRTRNEIDAHRQSDRHRPSQARAARW